MMNRTLSTLMASGAILGSLMVGCSGAGVERPRLAMSEAPGLAPKIERLLAGKDAGRALALAEQLVEASPQDADARALLGRAYLAYGRYASARTAFTDALALGNRDPRAIVSLALSEVGLGNLGGARQILAAHADDLPAGDYGLAMTMAGDPQEGARALIEAARAPDATAKTRQNLAYALAMAGAWGQARLIAGQDLSGREAELRIGEWARAIGAGGESDRVIAMIGVAPRADDAGLPTRLALNIAPEARDGAVQLARAADPSGDGGLDAKALEADISAQASDEAPAFEPNALAAALSREPVPSAPASTSTGAVHAVAFSPPSEPALAATPRQHAIQAAVGSRAPGSTGGAPQKAGFAAPAKDARTSDWVVQIGAYESAAIAKEKWRTLTRNRGALKAFPTVQSVVAVNGRSFHRLAIRGFEGRGSAAAACSTLKSLGQACFVRLDDTDSTRVARAEGQRQSQALAGARPSGRKGTAR